MNFEITFVEMAVPSRNVAYKKPEEPSFLKAFKSKVGYREPATVGMSYRSCIKTACIIISILIYPHISVFGFRHQAEGPAGPTGGRGGGGGAGG